MRRLVLIPIAILLAAAGWQHSGPGAWYSGGVSSFTTPGGEPPPEYTETCSTATSITAVPEKSWCKLTVSLSDVEPSPTPPGVTGPRSVVDAWSGAAYDQATNCLLVNGGGHNDYAGNEIYAVCLDDVSVNRIWGPTVNAQIPTGGCCYETYSNGDWAAVHTYGGLVVHPGTNKLFRFGGSRWGIDGNPSTYAWEVPLDTLVPAQLSQSIGGVGYFGNAVYTSSNDRILFVPHSPEQIAVYNPYTDGYAGTGNTFNANFHYEYTLAYDADDDVVVAVGDGYIHHINPTTGAFSTPSTSGSMRTSSNSASRFNKSR